MPKDEHVQEFIKLLKEELKKDRKLNARAQHFLQRGRPIPPRIMVKMALQEKQDSDMIDLAATACELWIKQTYPEEIVPPAP